MKIAIIQRRLASMMVLRKLRFECAVFTPSAGEDLTLLTVNRIGRSPRKDIATFVILL
jgi:hypothetical protein